MELVIELVIVIFVLVMLASCIVSYFRDKIKKQQANAKHYLIYEDMHYFDGNYIKHIFKHIPQLLKLGLLERKDLYIDLTGGDDTMGVSDYMLIKLRMEQNCNNVPSHSGATILIPPYDFRERRYQDKSGKWVYYRYRYCLEMCYGWTMFWNNNLRKEKNGIFKKGYMYIDKGSGNRVSKEWYEKLEKLIKAYDYYEEMTNIYQVNNVNLKFKELENKGE